PLRRAAQRAFIICDSFLRPAGVIPPFLRDFLPLDAFALGTALAAALARAQRARAAAAMRARPAAERPPRRLREGPAVLAGAELATLLGALELPKRLASRLCS